MDLEDNGSFESIVNQPDLVGDEKDLLHVVADVYVLNYLVVLGVLELLHMDRSTCFT